MKRQKSIQGIGRSVLAALLLAALAAGCRKELELPAEDGTMLLVVGTAVETPPAQAMQYSGERMQGPATRAVEVNKTFTFEDGDALSLFMRGATYADVDNRKVAYSKPGSGAGTWTIGGSSILLNDRTAVVSLVYPHTTGAVYDNIPFTTGVYSPAKDLLWKQQDVYAAVHEARVEQMRHALTRVKIVLRRDDPGDTTIPGRYTGTGDVTSVTLSNGTAAGSSVEAIFTDGVLDLSFSAPASPVRGTTPGALADNTPFSLPVDGHTTDLLTLPAAAMKQDLVTLTVGIDGGTMTTSLPYAAPADKWEAGKCYTYTVTVKSRGIQVTSSTVDNWTAGTAGDNDVVVPPPTLEVDPNGILTFNGKMLFFQFGSVVGFAQEGAWGADKVLFNPTAGSPDYSSYSNIPVYTSGDWNAGRRNVSDAAYHNGANIKLGKGDPCKLVGLTAEQIKSMTAEKLDTYDSGWRLPTKDENVALVNGNTIGNIWVASEAQFDDVYYSGGSAGGWFPNKSAADKVFLPATGQRYYSGGRADRAGSEACYWSSEAYNSSHCYCLYFHASRLEANYTGDYAYGFGVRCVKATP